MASSPRRDGLATTPTAPVSPGEGDDTLEPGVWVVGLPRRTPDRGDDRASRRVRGPHRLPRRRSFHPGDGVVSAGDLPEECGETFERRRQL